MIDKANSAFHGVVSTVKTIQRELKLINIKYLFCVAKKFVAEHNGLVDTSRGSS